MPTPATAVRLQRIGIDVPLVEGDGYTVPDAAVAHYPDTAWPGEGSNTYVYGHAREGQFLDLWKVRTGDIVEVDMADGSTADYAVSQILPLVALGRPRIPRADRPRDPDPADVSRVRGDRTPVRRDRGAHPVRVSHATRV